MVGALYTLVSFVVLISMHCLKNSVKLFLLMLKKMSLVHLFL